MFQIDANAWHRPCPNHIDCVLSGTERLKMNGRGKMERTARSLLATASVDHQGCALQKREMDATVAPKQNSTPLAKGPTASKADRGQVCGSEVAAAQRKSAFATKVGVVAVLAVVWWVATQSGLPSLFVDQAGLRALVERVGMLGPVAIIVLLVAAIVFSPIPSGPLAMAAGAAYGPVPGTLYVVIGATAGASLAFMIARRFGHDAVRRSLTGRLSFLTRDRPQSGVLMTIVFVSRLVPILSGDDDLTHLAHCRNGWCVNVVI